MHKDRCWVLSFWAFERVSLRHHEFGFYCIALHRGALDGKGMG
jgi:hypothetical protein